jgi:hypothetical protein
LIEHYSLQEVALKARCGGQVRAAYLNLIEGKPPMIPWQKLKFACAASAIWGGCVFIAWAAGYVQGFPPPWFNAQSDARSKYDLEFADLCSEWRIESQTSQFLDGPVLAKRCRYYLGHRSDKEAEEDELRWQQRIEKARQEWARASEHEPSARSSY